MGHVSYVPVLHEAAGRTFSIRGNAEKEGWPQKKLKKRKRGYSSFCVS